jgi:cell division protein ZapA (FtsZ GTPase activity inhibitor)
MEKSIMKTEIYDKAVHFKISADQKAAIEQIARLYDRSVASYLRVLINDAMKKHEVE